jgi:hypothetical protein
VTPLRLRPLELSLACAGAVAAATAAMAIAKTTVFNIDLSSGFGVGHWKPQPIDTEYAAARC